MADPGGWFYEIESERRGPVSLAELKRLVHTKLVGPHTKVFAEGMAEPVEAARLAVLFPPAPDAGMRWLLPVGRSGFAIAAGYLGLFSLIPFVGILAIVFAGLAIADLRKHPEKSGWGRVVFALIIGGLFTTLYGIFFLQLPHGPGPH
jgi:hypothetical protein